MPTAQTEPISSPELASIEDYLRALRRRSWILVVCLALALAAAFVYTNGRVDSFTATSRVLVGATPVGSIDSRLNAPNLDREAEVIVSDPVAVEVGSRLGDGVDALQLRRDLQVEFQPDSDVIRLSFTDESPEFAAAVANTFAQVYVEQRVGEQDGYFSNLVSSLDAQIASLEAEVVDFEAAIASVDSRRTNLLAVSTAAESAQALSDLAAERQTAVTQRNQVLASLRTLNSDRSALDAERATQAPAASFLREAATPTAAVGFADSNIWAGAALLGLLLGAVLAFVLYRLDRNATDSADVELALGARVIGRIPKIGLRRLSGPASLVLISGNKSVSHQRGREAFRRLRSSVEFLRSSADARAFIVTSTQPGEGKSVTSANLALALAGRNERVALVSADLRRPTIDTFFGTEQESGLSDFVGGVVTDLNFADVPEAPTLQLVPSGPVPENAGDLLASSLFRHIVEELRSHVDYVVFDTPPVGSAADAVSLAPLVDGVILVVDGALTTTTELSRVRSDIEQAGGKIVGAVMNRDRSESRRLFSRGNRYSYERTGTR